MQFQKLRVAGFKSFVESTEVPIEPGLSGIVGPNGCGKSNLVEALRFVMGESSYKAMRGAGMDDVIFSGNRARPAHNAAEVSLFVETTGKADVPARTLEVMRRIEREAGSAYRIDGREVRARDIQMLFADAATGTRSSALVRQGQISELIAAKPEQRRAILEDAAGISGLHARRSEAERKLKAAEENLARLDDVLGEIDAHVASLRKQARQAVRYRGLSDDIRQAEATLLLVRHCEARRALEEADGAMAAAVSVLAERMTVQVESVRREAVAAQGLPGLRETAAAAAAALQRGVLLQEDLDRQETRAAERRRELKRLIDDAERDIADDRKIMAQVEEAKATLAAETASLQRAATVDEEAFARLEAVSADAAGQLERAERDFEDATRDTARQNARRQSLMQTIAETREQSARLSRERAEKQIEIQTLEARLGSDRGLEALRQTVELAAADLARSEKKRQTREREAEEARRTLGKVDAPFEAARARFQDHEAQVKALKGVLAPVQHQGFAPILDRVEVDAGFEVALTAALGDDLDAATENEAPVHWRSVPAAVADSPLPNNVQSLADHVRGPAALARRLASVGIVTTAEAECLSGKIAQGQRLVTREGGLWRWDGYHRAPGAPMAGARRLEQQNHLAVLEQKVAELRDDLEAARAKRNAAKEALAASDRAERAGREEAAKARRSHSDAQNALLAARDEATQDGQLLGAAREGLARIEDALRRSMEDEASAQAALNSLPPLSADGDEGLEAQRSSLAAARLAAEEARHAIDQVHREQRARQDRRAAIAEQLALWEDRRVRSESRLERLDSRLRELTVEAGETETDPKHFAERRRALLDETGRLEREAASAADALAQAEQVHARHAKAAREAIEALALAREDRARAEARLDAGRDKREAVEAQARERFNCPAHALWKLAGLDEDAPLPQSDAIERRLERLKRERERLGGVNLQAETEMRALEERHKGLLADKTDVEAAVRQLHGGIASLNREGRERLTTAFDEVSEHFESLFRHLFGGGEAQLQLVGSDDPLDAGLDIMARPPGKRPQSMTLLSGGEQALTALALIFAVFLTNPSPICVLDEVDAPLDDANVERFCALLEDMRSRTTTRFLVVTHNPITMARMDRLFGVTMAERGISQLVSVDLQTAEAYREAV